MTNVMMVFSFLARAVMVLHLPPPTQCKPAVMCSRHPPWCPMLGTRQVAAAGDVVEVRRARTDRPIAGPACVWGMAPGTEHVQDGVPVPGPLLPAELHKLQSKLREAP